MKKEFKQVRSFHGTDATWSMFQINCRVLGLTQSDVLEQLIKDWNVQQKAAVNEIIFKGREQ